MKRIRILTTARSRGAQVVDMETGKQIKGVKDLVLRITPEGTFCEMTIVCRADVDLIAPDATVHVERIDRMAAAKVIPTPQITVPPIEDKEPEQNPAPAAEPLIEPEPHETQIVGAYIDASFAAFAGLAPTQEQAAAVAAINPRAWIYAAMKAGIPDPEPAPAPPAVDEVHPDPQQCIQPAVAIRTEEARQAAEVIAMARGWMTPEPPVPPSVTTITGQRVWPFPRFESLLKAQRSAA